MFTHTKHQHSQPVSASVQLAVSRAQAICTEMSYLISHSLFTTCIQSPSKHQHSQSTITWIHPPRNQQHLKSTHKLLLAFIIPKKNGHSMSNSHLLCNQPLMEHHLMHYLDSPTYITVTPILTLGLSHS